MGDVLDLSSDTSNSDKTIILENDDINFILSKYKNDENHLSKAFPSDNSKRNIYTLDEFSDDDSSKSATVKTVTSNSSWQGKFSANDFCDDSNDFNAVLNRISQLENEDLPKHTCSKEVETLFTGHIIQEPKKAQPVSTSDYLSSGDTKGNTNPVSYQKSDSDDSDKEGGNKFDLKAELENIKNNIKLQIQANNKQSDAESIESDSVFVEVVTEPKPKRIRKNNSVDKDAQKREKEIANAAKAREKEQKRLEKEKQKQLKNALKIVETCVKPDQCIQYLTVNIDEFISNKHYGEVIKAGLKSGGYNYKISKQLVPNLISWTRKVPTIENMFLQNVCQQEKHFLVVMEMPELIKHTVENTLTGHIQSLLSLPEINHLSIALLGLQKYYKFRRDEKNREFKAAVSEVNDRKTSTSEFSHLPKVHKKEIERKLVELQIFCKNIYVRPIEKFEDLAVFVGECTKSVAQMPYKLAKAESLQQENECFTVNNRDCVKVDKDGNGLNRLWNQFLRMFPLASLETAEAVTSIYPTISSLLEAYKKCANPEDGERLLQDLPVRRAAGPLGGQRKLGPEFSRRAYKFFCSKENALL